MGAIFGISGQYSDKNITDMKAMLNHRGKTLTVIQSEEGFIGSLSHENQGTQSSIDTSSHGVVVDGYLNKKISLSMIADSHADLMPDSSGLYSVAVLDKSTGAIHLYRDPSGARPLYIVKTPSRFAFASIPEALLVLEDVHRELSPQGVLLYVTMICPPDPHTIYQNIEMVRPGFTVTARGTTINKKPFWSAQWRPQHQSMSPRDAIPQLRQVMEDAVEDAIPENLDTTGFFLSGGTDTGAVVALAATNHSKPLNTFTIGYEGEGSGYEDYNEFYYAKLIAEKYGTNHHEFHISPDAVKKSLPGIIAGMHQPSGDAINTYLVAGTLPSDITTVLTGTAGDEVFIGSHWFRQQERLIRSYEKWRSVPAAFRSLAMGLTSLCAPGIHNRLQRLDALKAGVPAQYMHFKTMFPDYHQLFTPDFIGQLQDHVTARDVVNMYDVKIDGLDPVNRMEHLFFTHEVSNLQLRDVDSMSHAHGFEARSPLADRRILDILCQVSGPDKAPDGQLRHLMFQALGELLLTQTKTRRKMSFIVPMDLWARRDLKSMIQKLLSKESIEKRGVFRHEAVSRQWDAFYHTGKERHPFKIWNLALFELWCRYHIDAPPGSPIPDKVEDLV